MTDIAAFLTARLDEDQAVAEAAAAIDPGPWTADASDKGFPNGRSGAGSGIVYAADDIGLWDCEGSNTLCMTAPSAEHVARHDPDRVLREVAAKRAIIAIHAPKDVDAADDTGDRLATVCGNCDYEAWPCQTMFFLAAVYADHPDFDESWRP